MFCPRCSAQNKTEQKFCRNCGLSLPAVRLALEGKVDEAAATIYKDVDRMAGGAVTFGIFALIALITAFFDRGSAIINLVLGFLIAGPIFYSGLRRALKSVELIAPREASRKQVGASVPPPALEAADDSNAALSAVPDTNEMTPLPAPGSIAEHTTFELKSPGK
jgi:hypothetical protein